MLGRGNTSAKNITVSGVASFQNELLIPTTPTNKVGAIWVGSPSGTYTGSTSGGGGTSDYNQLINRPTNLSQFVNDLNNYGNWLTADGASYAGFASGALDYPYMRHASSGQVIRLLRYDQVSSLAFKDESLVHRYNTFTADANTVGEHTSNFTYANNAPQNGTLMHFGANNYGTQFNTNYQGGTELWFRTRNGDTSTWNGWNRIWNSTNLTPSVAAAGNSVVQRDANGYIQNSYIYTTDDVNTNGATLGYLVGKLVGNDHYHRSFSKGAIQGWLGLGDLAYTNNSAIDLQYVTNRGNTTTTGIGITREGVGHDPYGAMSVTRGNSSDYSYYGMTRSGAIGWGIGIDTSNRLIFGNNSSGGNNFTITSIPHAFDSAGNANHSNNITAGGSLNVAGASYLRNTHIQSGSVLYQNNADNSLSAQSDMRSDTLHQYVYRASDGAPLSWKENWYNSTGAVYHTWSTDSAGFVANSKITAISTGNGATTYAGALEVRGTNAGITFHYPAYYAASLYMGSSGILNWAGNGINSSTLTAGNYVYGANYVQGGRVVAGYDSGVAGSVNANGWFRSSDATGWYNSTYGGGVWMDDTTWVKVYGGKAFRSENDIYAGGQVRGELGFKSHTYRGMAGDYDTNGIADKIIWTIGDGWNTIAGHYGLGYSYNSGLYSSNHQLVGRHAGGTTFSLNLTSGGATFTGRVIAPEVQATGKMIIPTSAPSSMENGCIWIA